MRKIILTIVSIALCFCHITAQKKIDIGMTIGMSSHGGDSASWGRHGVGLFHNTKIAHGLNATYSINNTWGLRLQYRGTEIQGDDSDFIDKAEWAPQLLQRDFMYRSQISEFGVLLEHKFRHLFSAKNKNIESTELSKFYPFLTGGIAYAFVNDDENMRDWGDPPSFRDSDVLLDQSEGSVGGIQFPIGLGLRYELSEYLHTDLFYNFRLPVSDYLDGISESANPDKNDAYQICGINIGIRISKSGADRDDDGVADHKDECPDRAGSKLLFGCPDQDNDGIMDDYDNCPQKAGPAKNFGCPEESDKTNQAKL